MLTMIPNTQGNKRSSPSGGRIRSSCGYHHQRHQACHETCEGRKTHPPKEHTPMRDKFAVGCGACQAYFSEQHQDILSPVSKRLYSSSSSALASSSSLNTGSSTNSPSASSSPSSSPHLHLPSTPPSSSAIPHLHSSGSGGCGTPPHTPEQQLTTHHSFNKKYDDFNSISCSSPIPNNSPNNLLIINSSNNNINNRSPLLRSPSRSPVRSPNCSPPHTPKLASLTHEVEYEIFQHQHELSQKHRMYEQEEQHLLQYRQGLEKMRQQQDKERQRIQQQQQVLEYQKQQQELELQRIHQYQLELDDVRREQELQRHLLKQQQQEIAQARMELEQEGRLLMNNNGNNNNNISNKKHEIALPSSSASLLLKPSSSSSASSLTSSLPSFFLPMMEKSHSPNPTTRASHSMEEENAARDLMKVFAPSHKRPLSDIMGHESEEASHKSNTRRSG